MWWRLRMAWCVIPTSASVGFWPGWRHKMTTVICLLPVAGNWHVGLAFDLDEDSDSELHGRSFSTVLHGASASCQISFTEKEQGPPRKQEPLPDRCRIMFFLYYYRINIMGGFQCNQFFVLFYSHIFLIFLDLFIFQSCVIDFEHISLSFSCQICFSQPCNLFWCAWASQKPTSKKACPDLLVVICFLLRVVSSFPGLVGQGASDEELHQEDGRGWCLKCSFRHPWLVGVRWAPSSDKWIYGDPINGLING